MKVEFDYNPEKLEILEHVVRDMDSIDDEGNSIEKKPHLQIRCKPTANYPCTLLANVTYKDNSGKFLGLDEGAAWKAEKDPSKLTYLISDDLSLYKKIKNKYGIRW